MRGTNMFGRREPERYDYPILSIYDDVIHPKEYNCLVQNIENLQKKSIIYIHIPFCANQCIFCNYYKISQFNISIIENYFLGLKTELKYYASKLRKRVEIRGIHFGGGTPSIVPVKYYSIILEYIRSEFLVTETIEVSFEGNITSLIKDNYIKELKEVGINRVSFGIQTFNSQIRSSYGLKGDYETVVKLCDKLNSVKIHNYNSDLMFNFPGQSVSEVYEDVVRTFELGVKTIDLYSLLIYPETKMYNFLQKTDMWEEYSNKRNINKFLKLFKLLDENNRYKFTMSNTIAKINANENIILSTQLGNNSPDSGNVIGIGASSRGYIGGLKYKNYVDIKRYLSSLEKFGFGAQLGRKLTELEINTRWLVMAPNFMKIDTSLGVIDENIHNILELLHKNKYFSMEQSKYIFNSGMNFWAGNISSLLMDFQETKRMKSIVLKNRKNHLNMYNQDKMQIVKEKL